MIFYVYSYMLYVCVHTHTHIHFPCPVNRTTEDRNTLHLIPNPPQKKSNKLPVNRQDTSGGRAASPETRAVKVSALSGETGLRSHKADEEGSCDTYVLEKDPHRPQPFLSGSLHPSRGEARARPC